LSLRDALGIYDHFPGAAHVHYLHVCSNNSLCHRLIARDRRPAVRRVVLSRSE
jgi:hypothetical protein